MPKQSRVKALNDWALVKVDPLPKENTQGGILLVEPHMVRTGVVVNVGKGKLYHDQVYRPTQLKPGERIAFFAGTMDTKQGKAISHKLDDDHALVRETDALFVIELEGGEAIPRITK